MFISTRLKFTISCSNTVKTFHRGTLACTGESDLVFGGVGSLVSSVSDSVT